MSEKRTWREMGEVRRQQLRDGTWVNPWDLLLAAQDIDRGAFRYPLTKEMAERRALAYAQARADAVRLRAAQESGTQEILDK